MTTLRAILSEAAHKAPDQLYLQHKNSGVTFGEVLPALTQLSNQLPPMVSLRVLILLPDSLNAALLHMACFANCATLIPLSPFVPAATLDYILARVQPDLVVTTAILQKKFEGLLERAPLVTMDDAFPAHLKFANSMRPRNSVKPASPVRAILFTSGTTGTPKGVCLSEASLFSAATINSTILTLSSSRRSLVMVQLYDYYGLIQLYSHALANAACILGESGQFFKSALQAIGNHAITDLVLVPFTLKSLLDFLEGHHDPEYQHAWKHVAYVATSSDRLSQELLTRAFKLSPSLTIANVYGLTEAGRACFRIICKGSLSSDSIGSPSPTMRVWVDAPVGEAGQILISGPTVMLGYMQGIADDQICFSPVTEIRTGDEGYVGPDNEIHLVGRSDHLLNLYGEKLHPSEIELPVSTLPGVKNSLVWLDCDENGRKNVVLNVVADEQQITEEQILQVLRPRVPRVFLPHAVRFVDSIPRTEIGSKVIRPKQ